ncbi:MAG: glycosyltransferase [Myxococcales bacterium]|nr:glycosyltransferase [Myxococcales bacterium]MCB9577188.1 glycosyltransferase [Polyangiaceae bacterium]
MTAPLVSVLLPAFDAGATIELSLRSIQRQTHASWECIVVDDGSRDGTAAIARGLGDPRIRVLSLPHGGIVRALTAGLAECRGAFVARMDADDVAHRMRLELSLRALDQHPSWVAVGSHVRMFPRGSLKGGLYAYEAWLNSMQDASDVRRERFVECPIAHPTLVIRRDVLGRYGYRSAGWAEDYDLFLRLLEDGHSLGVVPRRLLGWRDGLTRLSRTSVECSMDRMVACKAAFLAAGFLQNSERYVLWGYGDTGKKLARALTEHDRRPVAIVELHPGRIGQRIAGAPVIPPSELPKIGRHPILASVAGPGPRSEIRAALREMGFQEDRDFLCCA